MEADDLLCSRNARPEKGLVGRAQWKINQPPSPEEKASELGGIICNLAAVGIHLTAPHETGVGKGRCSFDARSKGQPWPLP